MVIAHHTIRRLKDTFECTSPYDEIRQQQRIIGRHVLSSKKLQCLPFHHDSNYNMNSSEIPPAPPFCPSLIFKKQRTSLNGHDIQQSKIKNLVIDELKNFFASRNQNNQQQCSKIQFPVPVSTPTKKQIVQHKTDSNPTTTTTNEGQLTEVTIPKTICNSERLLSIPSTFATTSTALLASMSLLTSILLSSDLIRSTKKFSTTLNLLSDTLFYSSSFTLGCFGARCIKQTHSLHVYRFGNMLTKSLLLHTFLTMLSVDRNLSQRQRALIEPIRTITIPKYILFTRQDILIRIITSTLHLIAGFAINFHDKNIS